MPRIATNHDRGRLRAAILIAAGLHGLVFALFAFLPAPGIALYDDNSTPGISGAGSLAGHARSGEMRVIPILVTPLGHDELSPRGASPSRVIADQHAITDHNVPIATNGGTDIVVAEDTAHADAVGAAGDGDADGIGNTGDIHGTFGADGTDGAGSFGTTQRAFAYWLDSAIRARLSYPERARARNAEGTVVVALTVPADGSRCDALVAKTSGSAILDRAAVELIRSLFPAKVAPGSPFSAPVRICFTLTSSP